MNKNQSGMNTPHFYSAFGLIIKSDIECPELTRSDLAEPEVSIDLGTVPETLEDVKHAGVLFQVKPDAFLLKVDHVANYLVTGGNRVIVMPHKDAKTRDIRTFLLGSVFGALIHQRRLLPLHGSAIKVGEECVLFCGPSGAGKSTTANALIKRGYALHADDISVVDLDALGAPRVYSGFPQLKLWEDALIKSGQNPDDYEQIRQVMRKYAVPATENFSCHSLPLKKVYVLSTFKEKGFKTVPITGFEKFNMLKLQTYRLNLMEGFQNFDTHFKIAHRIGEHIPMLRMQRSELGDTVEDLVNFLEQDFLP
jgi:hypothetical protein